MRELRRSTTGSSNSSGSDIRPYFTFVGRGSSIDVGQFVRHVSIYIEFVFLFDYILACKYLEFFIIAFVGTKTIHPCESNSTISGNSSSHITKHSTVQYWVSINQDVNSNTHIAM